VDGSGDIDEVSAALLSATCDLIHASGSNCLQPWCRCSDDD
jgi:hypothetical protein